jgi:cytochrome c
MTRMVAAIALLAATMGLAQAQDPDAGKAAFKRCSICHAIGEDAQNKIGPELNGLDGRKAGSVADFDYSDAHKDSGIVWSEATFKQYIKDPQAKVPGTKKVFAGLKDEQQAADLWAYLRQFNADGSLKK